jgi:hypothetical protein
MATQITNRNDFKQYCLRRLGFPVIEINVDDDQVEDRIDDALQYWQDYHFDGLQKVYFIRSVTGSEIVSDIDISNLYGTNMMANNVFVGATSGSIATIRAGAFGGIDKTTIYVIGNQAFSNGESILYYSNTTGLTPTGANVVSYTMGDVDRRYLDLSDTKDQQGNAMEIVGVPRIFPVTDSQATVNMFDLRYQLRLNELYDFTSASYINYTLTQQHLRSLELMFTGEVPIRFQRHMQRLYIDWAWGYSEAPVGSTVVAECYANINPDVYKQVWNDRWLKEYATALVKRSWGSNLKKFNNLQLPGGVTLNGDTIFDEAVKEIDQLHKEMETNYGAPLEFFLN